MRAIEFCRDVGRQPAPTECRCCKFRIRSGGEEISTEREEHASFLRVHRFDSLHGVVTVTARRLEVKFRAKVVKEHTGRAFPDSHRPVALNITVASNRTKTGSRFSNLPAQ